VSDEILRELLAALSHEQWAGWMDYLLSKSTLNDDGTATIPAWAVERWWRQILTPYSKLSEQEKDSDRKEADKIVTLLKANDLI
jgi:hypothetical protein